MDNAHRLAPADVVCSRPLVDGSALDQLRSAAKGLRVAIVHDWLVTRGGAEKVLQAFLRAFPQAHVFTLVDSLADADRAWLGQPSVTTSFLQRMPLAKRHYRYYLPLMPAAVERFNVADYDLVISSSHAVAKGIPTHSDQAHICYCHTPMRYAWDMREGYLQDAGWQGPKAWLARYSLHRLRQWDFTTAAHVDHFWANSNNVKARIDSYYHREAEVLYPPVDVDALTVNEGERDDFYLAASRLVPYKRLDLIIEAFRAMPDKRLVVIGNGPDRKRLEALAEGASNIELLGYREDAVLHDYLRRARAFVFAADEDFGILPLEAQASGTPVIAYGSGGALETVRAPESQQDPAATGIFFDTQTPDSLRDAVASFETRRFDPSACRHNAERFSHSVFWRRTQTLLTHAGLVASPS